VDNFGKSKTNEFETGRKGSEREVLDLTLDSSSTNSESVDDNKVNANTNRKVKLTMAEMWHAYEKEVMRSGKQSVASRKKLDQFRNYNQKVSEEALSVGDADLIVFCCDFESSKK
jgi:hypothetical protein